MIINFSHLEVCHDPLLAPEWSKSRDNRWLVEEVGVGQFGGRIETHPGESAILSQVHLFTTLTYSAQDVRYRDLYSIAAVNCH